MNGAMREQSSFNFAEAPAAIPDERELVQARHAVLECLSPSPTSVDEVVRDCHVSTSLVSAVLLELELAGRIERQPGNKVSLTG
jgi:DNA processing protein